MESGESKWITSDGARQDVHRLRARSSAIVTGAGTVLADDPSMTARLEGIERQPLRVIIDTNLSTPVDAKILKQDGQAHILTCSDDEDSFELLTNAGAKVVRLPMVNSRVDLFAMMDYLNELEVNEVLLETGSTLSGAMLEAQLIDELVIYMAPIVMGNEARSLFRLPHLQTMADRIELSLVETRSVGSDLRLIYQPRYTS